MSRAVRWSPLPLAFLAAAVVCLAWSPGWAGAQDGAPPVVPDGWRRLGPGSEYAGLDGAGVAPTWPADRTLLIARDRWLARSDDDGATWTRLPGPGVDVAGIWPAPGVDRTGIVLLVRTIHADQGRPILYRSTDRGATWAAQPLPTGPISRYHARVHYSPSFEADGVAFLSLDGRAFRSVDAGVTWQPIVVGTPHGTPPEPLSPTELPAGQYVEQIQLSPTFAQDRTVFLAIVTTPHRRFSLAGARLDGAGRLSRQPDDHAVSVGVAVSRDGGETWAPAATGLEIAGEPYRYVRDLAISPTFVTDGTLFAWAWGPGYPAEIAGQPRIAVANALFRTRDGGQTWEPVWEQPILVPGFAVASASSATIALSPAFEQDGVMIAGLSSARRASQIEYSQASVERRREVAGQCDLWRSSDGGSSWSRVEASEPDVEDQLCGAIIALEHPAEWRVLRRHYMTVDTGWWERSSDAGLTWTRSELPRGWNEWLGVRAVGPDSQALVAGAQALWVVDGTLGPEPGPLTCPLAPAPELERFAGVSSALNYLGCPAEPARSVRLLERHISGTRGLWPDVADEPSWLLMPGTAASWEWRSKETDPWPGPPDDAYEAVLQRFWGGLLLWYRDLNAEARVVELVDPLPEDGIARRFSRHCDNYASPSLRNDPSGQPIQIREAALLRRIADTCPPRQPAPPPGR